MATSINYSTSRLFRVCTGICLTLGTTGWCLTQPQVIVVDLARIQPVAARAEILGHNMTSIDWHGTTGSQAGTGWDPIIWDPAANAPNPLWQPLTSDFPLRVMRFHSGNNYDWKSGVGPQENRRPIKPSESWARPYRPNSGLDEFLRWIESLPLQPDVSLIASPLLPVGDLEDLVAYCNSTEGAMASLRAQNGHPSPYNIKYWELGNEIDWHKRADLDILRKESAAESAAKISPAEYVKLCAERIDALRKIDPDIRFQAHAQTAPWPDSNPQWRNWHREVLSALGPELDGIVIHPYYDGHRVPYALRSIDVLIADIKALSPVNRFGRALTVVVNEHARWVDPSRREAWARSSSLQGAISTGDFLLQLMARPEVSTANYWCFAHRGPWRVVDVNDGSAGTTKRLIPTSVYHLFKMLNDSLLPEYRLLSPLSDTPSSALGGDYPYHITAGFFSDPKTTACSLVAVNRSPDHSYLLELKGARQPADSQADTLFVTANNLEDGNTQQTPTAVPMIRRQTELAWLDGSLRFQIPPKSLVSLRWR